MVITIGIKYKETKSKLKKIIMNGDVIPLETIAENHGCYLCGGHIEGKMFVLILKDERGDSKFYVDKGCYKKAQTFVEYSGMDFSLN
jgi:hypothetical protein